MRQKLLKMYTIERLKEDTEDFNKVQAIMNGYNIKFNVVFFKDDKIGIIAFVTGKEEHNILKSYGFDEKGE